MTKKSRDKIMKLTTPLLPVGSKRRQAAKAFFGKYPLPSRKDITYRGWIRSKEPALVSGSKPITSGPQISLVVPCYDTPRRYIKDLISSLVNQTYGSWQLYLADGSAKTECSDAIRQAAAADSRITYIKLKKNLGIAENTNKAIEKATGEYIAFLDHDDMLPTWALAELVSAIKDNPKAEIFYSDEDRLSEDGKVRQTPLFKPDWSPDLFLCLNYPAHFLVVKRKLVNKLGGLRSEFDGSQDYDFLLRALDHRPQIVHIPKILYHMRLAETSTAKRIGVKGYAHGTGNDALTDYLRRNHIPAKVLAMPDHPTNHRIKYEIKGSPLVSIIIPFKDKVSLLKACVASIQNKTPYKNYEIILLSNNSTEKRTTDYLGTLEDKNIKVHYYNKPFNYSAINNFGRTKAAGQVLVFLNNDTEVINGEWLEELTSIALRKDTGAVGAMLQYPDGSLQHAGVIVGMSGAAGHVFRGLKPSTPTYFGNPIWPRNYLAVTGACLALETKKFDKVGGFNEDIIIAGSDVVLCLGLYAAGYLNVYWPYARLKHYESKSVGGHGTYKNVPPTDYDICIEYYRPYLDHKDPYFSPNLDLTSEWPKIRSDYE